MKTNLNNCSSITSTVGVVLLVFSVAATISPAAIHNITYSSLVSDYKSTIDSTISSASDGDTLQFSDGNFPVYGQITTTKSLVIKGVGDNATAIVQKSSSSTLFYCNFAINKSISFSDISLKTDTSANTALKVEYSSAGSTSPGLTAERLHIAQAGPSDGSSRSGSWDYGIVLKNASHSVIKDCHLSNESPADIRNFDGIALRLSGDCSDLLIYNTGFAFWHQGLEILGDGTNGSETLSIVSSVFAPVNWGVTYFYTQSTQPGNITVEGSHFDVRGAGTNTAINLAYVDALTVSACAVYLIYHDDDAYIARYHVVAGATSSLIENNAFVSSNSNDPTGLGGGVVLLSGSTGTVINANSFSHNELSYATWIQSGASNCTISNNMYRNVTYKINDEGTGTTSVNN